MSTVYAAPIPGRVLSTILRLQDKVKGNKCALLVRSGLQKGLFNLGCFEQRHCGKVLTIGILCLLLLGVGLRIATVESDIGNLWVESEYGSYLPCLVTTQLHLCLINHSRLFHIVTLRTILLVLLGKPYGARFVRRAIRVLSTAYVMAT